MARKNLFNSSSNPLFKGEKYKENAINAPLDSDLINAGAAEGTMTVSGAVNKTLILTGLMLITTLFSFTFPSQMLMYIGMFGGIGVFLWTSMQPHRAPVLAPVYALLEGLFVGTISYMFQSIAGTSFIIFQAVSLTLALLFTMLMIHKAGWIEVNQKFRSAVIMASGAIMLVYLLNFVLSFFGTQVPFLHQSGPIGIGITIAILGVACMMLLLDFDNFEKGEKYNAAKYMEWYSAMGLIATIVWIYYEALHLVSMLSGD